MEMMDTRVDIYKSSAYENAFELLDSYGRVPPIFHLTIKALIYDSVKSRSKIPSTPVDYIFSKLFRSPTLKVTLYRAFITFFEEQNANAHCMTLREIAGNFYQDELALIIASKYYYSVVAKKLNPEQKKMFNSLIAPQCDLGGLIGSTIPEISISAGILIGSFLPIAHMLLSLEIADKQHEDPFKVLQCEETIFEEMLGTNKLAMIVAMLQRIGTGTDWANSFNKIYHIFFKHDKLQYHSIVPNSLESRILSAQIWIDSLNNDCQVPKIELPASFHPQKVLLYKLLYQAERITLHGTLHNWINSSLTDIESISKSHLFREYINESLSISRVSAEFGSDLPYEIKEDLSNLVIEKNEIEEFE
jgi:hypothetical protein